MKGGGTMQELTRAFIELIGYLQVYGALAGGVLVIFGLVGKNSKPKPVYMDPYFRVSLPLAFVMLGVSALAGVGNYYVLKNGVDQTELSQRFDRDEAVIDCIRDIQSRTDWKYRVRRGNDFISISNGLMRVPAGSVVVEIPEKELSFEFHQDGDKITARNLYTFQTLSDTNHEPLTGLLKVFYRGKHPKR